MSEQALPHLPHPENRVHARVWVVYTRTAGVVITNARERLPSRFIGKVEHANWSDVDVAVETEQLQALGVSVRNLCR